MRGLCGAGPRPAAASQAALPAWMPAAKQESYPTVQHGRNHKRRVWRPATGVDARPTKREACALF